MRSLRFLDFEALKIEKSFRWPISFLFFSLGQSSPEYRVDIFIILNEDINEQTEARRKKDAVGRFNGKGKIFFCEHR